MTKILLACSVVKSLRLGCVVGRRVGNTSAWLRLQTTKLFSVKVRKRHVRGNCCCRWFYADNELFRDFHRSAASRALSLQYASGVQAESRRKTYKVCDALPIHKMYKHIKSCYAVFPETAIATPIFGIDPAQQTALVFS